MFYAFTEVDLPNRLMAHLSEKSNESGTKPEESEEFAAAVPPSGAAADRESGEPPGSGPPSHAGTAPSSRRGSVERGSHRVELLALPRPTGEPIERLAAGDSGSPSSASAAAMLSVPLSRLAQFAERLELQMVAADYVLVDGLADIEEPEPLVRLLIRFALTYVTNFTLSCVVLIHFIRKLLPRQ